jgi:hypothetical protein
MPEGGAADGKNGGKKLLTELMFRIIMDVCPFSAFGRGAGNTKNGNKRLEFIGVGSVL